MTSTRFQPRRMSAIAVFVASYGMTGAVVFAVIAGICFLLGGMF